MPTGHTQTDTINARVPLSAAMEGIIVRMARVGFIQLSRLRKGDRATIRALVDRGFVIDKIADGRFTLTASGVAKAGELAH